MRSLLLHLPLYIQVCFAHYLFCFEVRTSIFRNSVIWYNSFRTSILYLPNIRFIIYGPPLIFFPNIRWRTEMSLPNISSLSYEHLFCWLRTSVRFFSEHPWQTKCQFRTSNVKYGCSEWQRRNVRRPSKSSFQSFEISFF